MNKKEIRITIGKDGGVSFGVDGVGGPDCIDFTEFLEEALGEVVSREKTAQYYEQEEREGVRVQLGDD